MSSTTLDFPSAPPAGVPDVCKVQQMSLQSAVLKIRQDNRHKNMFHCSKIERHFN